MKQAICQLFIITLYSGLIAQNQDNSVIPPKRAHHQLVYDEGRKTILMTAGSTPLDGGNSFAFFNDIWAYNGKEWKLLGKTGDERSGIALDYDSKRNKLFSVGGFTKDNSSHGELRVLEKGEWKTLSDIPEMKGAEPGLVYDSHHDWLIAFGGSPGRGLSNKITWIWEDGSWRKIEGHGPEGRQAFVMVYDEKRKKTIVYGGSGTGSPEIFTDIWEFDGDRWTKISKPGPGTRISPGAAYDSKRGLLIVFGGMGPDGFLNDTWSWDGNEWQKLATEGPAKRVMGYMAYDKSRDRIVLFGGRLGWPNDANDTWEWDGKQWTEVK